MFLGLESAVRRLLPGNANILTSTFKLRYSVPNIKCSPNHLHLNHKLLSRSFQTASHGIETSSSDPPPDFAFAFDIDGVLMHGRKPYPPAKETLKLLQSKNIEFLFLTNGGGYSEAKRATELTRRLDIDISEKQIVQSHTPFKKIAQDGGEYGRQFENVLVVGGISTRCRIVALGYGFKNVVIPTDILIHNPQICPIAKVTDSVRRDAKPFPCDPLKIDAIFVFNDPINWALDIQVIIDLLLSKDGVLGTYSPKNDEGQYQNDGQPLLYFSNPDLLWASDYHQNRLGQGAFRNALQGIWKEITAIHGHDPKELKYIIIGKPHSHTYAYAEQVLNDWRNEQIAQSHPNHPSKPLQRIYMVGDNPDSDIKGANDYNKHHNRQAEWFSILVQTGVYRGGWVAPPPRYTPNKIAKDVWEAVNFALERESRLQPQ